MNSLRTDQQNSHHSSANMTTGSFGSDVTLATNSSASGTSGTSSTGAAAAGAADLTSNRKRGVDCAISISSGAAAHSPCSAYCAANRPSFSPSRRNGPSRSSTSPETLGTLTAFRMVPVVRYSTIASQTMVATFCWASSVDPPRCGVAMKLGQPKSGWSEGGGSCSKTSSAAPPSEPLRSASASAFSSTSPPRAQFTTSAPGFICASCAAPTMFFVCSVSGTCRVMASLRRKISGRSTSSTPSLAAASGERNGSYPSTFIPKACARFTTSVPMLPVPITPRVLPRSSRPAANFFFSHLPARVELEASATWRASARSRATVCSATDTLLPPGAFITTTPRRVAAARSMLSTPVPARPTTRSFAAASRISLVTLVALRTASAS